MKFNSVKEYFYRLYTMGFQLMMIPLILIIIHYSQSFILLPQLVKVSQEGSLLLFILSFGVAVGVVAAVQVLTVKQANRIAKEVGLGLKLEMLGALLMKKMITLFLSVFIMSLLLLLTRDNYFSIGFGVFILWYFLQWPTPGRVSRLLKLKGDERQMVISRGDAFK